MSEKEKNEPHRIDRGLAHPAIALTAHMANRLYAAHAGAITAGEFQDLFHTTAADTVWSDHGINLRTAALMVATALHLQATLGSIAVPLSKASPSDPAAADASLQAQRTIATVDALSALADQFGGSSPNA